MNVKLLMLPLFMTGVVMVGCDDNTASSPDATVNARAADAEAAAKKDAADAKAAVEKAADDARAAMKKDAADASAAADKAAANVQAAADKASAGASHAAKLLADLQTAAKDKKWADAGTLVKQLDAVRDDLSAGQKAIFDGLKKQYNDNKG